MADVFVSYARADKGRVAPLVSALEGQGLSVWWDPAIAAGEQFDDQIDAAMDAANSVLVIWTPASVTSRWVRGEAREAADRGILVPVRFDSARLPLDVRALHTIDLDQWGNDPASPPFQEVLRSLHATIGRGGGPSSVNVTGRGTPQARPPERKRILAAIAIGAVALVAIAVAVGGRYIHLGSEARQDVAREDDSATAPSSDVHGAAAERAFDPPAHSVAVLAFANLSGDPKDEYFSDGLSEELLQALAQIAELKVAARTSSFSFKGMQVDVPTVGRKLNVGAVLEGSVRKDGGRVRVTAQLIDSVTGFHVWSENFDREFKDVIALQSELAYAVASALEVRLLGDGRTPGGTQDPKALDAFLRGRAGERIQDGENLRAALVALDEAVALDPGYANAHALRGDVLAQLASNTMDPAESQRLVAAALSAVRRGVALSPDSGFAQQALAGVLQYATTDYAATDAAYRRSIKLEPGNASHLVGYANFAVLMGRSDALATAKRALELDPLSPSVMANLGVVQYYSRQFDAARKSFELATQRFNNQVTLDWAALNELASGNALAALPHCERDVSTWSNQFCLAIAYHDLGKRKEADAMMRRLQDESGDGAAFQYAEIYAQWDRPSEAIGWLEKAAELRDPGMITIKSDPLLDPLRAMTRFQQIVAGLDFPT